MAAPGVPDGAVRAVAQPTPVPLIDAACSQRLLPALDHDGQRSTPTCLTKASLAFVVQRSRLLLDADFRAACGKVWSDFRTRCLGGWWEAPIGTSTPRWELDAAALMDLYEAMPRCGFMFGGVKIESTTADRTRLEQLQATYLCARSRIDKVGTKFTSALEACKAEPGVATLARLWKALKATGFERSLQPPCPSLRAALERESYASAARSWLTSWAKCVAETAVSEEDAAQRKRCFTHALELLGPFRASSTKAGKARRAALARERPRQTRSRSPSEVGGLRAPRGEGTTSDGVMQHTLRLVSACRRAVQQCSDYEHHADAILQGHLREQCRNAAAELRAVLDEGGLTGVEDHFGIAPVYAEVLNLQELLRAAVPRGPRGHLDFRPVDDLCTECLAQLRPLMPPPLRRPGGRRPDRVVPPLRPRLAPPPRRAPPPPPAGRPSRRRRSRSRSRGGSDNSRSRSPEAPAAAEVRRAELRPQAVADDVDDDEERESADERRPCAGGVPFPLPAPPAVPAAARRAPVDDVGGRVTGTRVEGTVRRAMAILPAPPLLPAHALRTRTRAQALTAGSAGGSARRHGRLRGTAAAARGREPSAARRGGTCRWRGGSP